MKPGRHASGFVLVELLSAIGVLLLVSITTWTVLHALMVLSAKNEAVNLTHQQAREAINRLGREIRSSVSVPQLINTSFNTLSGTSQAAGVRFQTVFRGPNKIHNNCNASSKNVRITRDPTVDGSPVGGMRLIIPALQIEADIDRATGVPGNSGVQDIQLQSRFGQYTNPAEQDVTCNNGTPVYATYITQRSAFLVVNGELRYYAHLSSGQYVVLARNIATANPFSFNEGDTRALRVSFITRDPRVTSRNYKSLDLTVNTVIPYRYRLTTYQ
jgi:hypothetical protein